ncbi:MAG: DEAD/DEAH box helicase [Chitinophagaceae bacterium]|jgi:ATP-independent RNA helicase DbpA|nr:DEAD/DEAH box helicase [Chitinophagaceae bacterium]MBK7680291.1 DEAD/DEAH box helicase [Chitinophagaceae bacterium]MBK8301723.1 DEAD/DEAH box helicase [Chitinophagaceae bacterium]MBK9466281.1 DEAD/DEAH box helicase [Chitinophagaceae bacterium]MBK9661210.1 DEAD/DEAH box helicase [Chitinophagaceae bacterium]
MSTSTVATESILTRLKIKSLNEMQLASIEAISTNNNTLLLSATGSGKTLAFLLPLVKLLDPAITKTQAIIIVPSRELALQIESVFKSMGTNLKVTCCYGGHLRETEENNLKQPPALLVGTPGRLADHIRRGNITTASIETLVLDEFDKSLELGFLDEMSFIIGALPAIQKRILTSATQAVEIPAFIKMDEPVTLNFLSAANEDTGLTVKTLLSDGKDKLETLFRLLCMLGNRSAIVFCNHRESVERTSKFLKEKDIINEFYHGAMEQQERDAALCKFRNGTTNVLVTTDLASRGLDIANIRYIIHYHLPGSEDIFTHRNGRTARMDASGTAIIILSPEEELPDYINPEAEQITLPETITLPDKPQWSTLFFAAGKKDKVNKIDIVGFLSNRGQLKKEDIGLIEVKDFFSFVAVKKIKVSPTLQLIKDQKIKNKKVKIAVAK